MPQYGDQERAYHLDMAGTAPRNRHGKLRIGGISEAPKFNMNEDTKENSPIKVRGGGWQDLSLGMTHVS